VEVYDPVVIDLETNYTSYGNSFPQVELSYDGNYVFYWTPPGGLTCTNCPEPFIMPDTVTTYFVEVTDIDSGCMIDSLIRVETINDCTEGGLHTPNIFSPNRDGANDGVRVFTQRETDFTSLGIYDRWGNQMFYSEDINQSWDGVYKSQLAQTGVYTLKIEGVCTDSGEAFVVYRDVSLVR
jgi:gliding motility-associated-like protein